MYLLPVTVPSNSPTADHSAPEQAISSSVWRSSRMSFQIRAGSVGARSSGRNSSTATA